MPQLHVIAFLSPQEGLVQVEAEVDSLFWRDGHLLLHVQRRGDVVENCTGLGHSFAISAFVFLAKGLALGLDEGFTLDFQVGDVLFDNLEYQYGLALQVYQFESETSKALIEQSHSGPLVVRVGRNDLVRLRDL